MTDQNNIEKIVQEAECVAAADEYFKARAWLMDTTDNRRIFEAGFDRAYALLSKLRAPGADERAIDLFRSALAWGMTYGQVLNQKQWDEMREKMAQQFSEKLRAPVAEPETMEEIHRRERERATWTLPKDPTLPNSAPVADSPRVDALMAQWDDDGATRGPAFIELRDLARSLEQRNDAIAAAISVAKESLFSQCCSNPIKNSWGKQVDLTKLNDLFDLASAPVACDHQFHFFGDQKERRCNRCNTLESKASAPVAGEAQKPVAWLREKTPGGGVWHRSVSLDEPPTGFIAIDRKTPLYAAPQASEAVRDAALNDAISILINLSARYRHNYDKEGCNSYHEGGSDALDEAEQAIRAALSAQPGAQK